MRWMNGLAYVPRHVIGCHLVRDTRVHNECRGWMTWRKRRCDYSSPTRGPLIRAFRRELSGMIALYISLALINK